MRLKLLAAGLVGLQLFLAVPVLAEAPATVYVNSDKVALKHQPIFINNSLYYAADDLAQLLKGTAKLERHFLTLRVGENELAFNLDTNQVGVKNKWLTLEQGGVLRNQTAYLPVRWVAERLGNRVKWDASTKTAQIILKEAAQLDQFVVEDPSALTADEQAFVASVKGGTGVHQKGNLVVIARGESPNPGYGIAYVKQQLSWEKLTIYVKLTKPEAGRMYPQVISYPYLLGRVELSPYTTISVIDVDTGEPLVNPNN